MRRALATAAVLAIWLVPAAPAGAAGGPTLRSLQAQITTLKKQVKTLQKREKQDRTLVLGSLVYTGCSLSVIADTFQGTWTALDQRFQSEGHAALFGAQTPANDYTTCQAFSVVRAKNQVPPTISVIQALLDVLFK